MARSFKYAIIRFSPNEVRGERLNIGAVIFKENAIDVRITRNLDRVRAISAGVEADTLRELLTNIVALDEQARIGGTTDTNDRLQRLTRIGPLSLSPAGTLVAESPSAYEAHVSSLLQVLVEPEPGLRKVRPKRSRLYTEVKKRLRKERILARRTEGLDSHRVVSGYQLDQGLVADLILRNGTYHVIETVDASGSDFALRRAISEIAISALVIERARMEFGQQSTKAKLIYLASAELERMAQPSLEAAAHQGAELCNWASEGDRDKLLNILSSLATPLGSNRPRRFVSATSGDLFH